ncbi:MAG: hypothetical protein E7256_16080 [Lachnospiraceae bacterium]|nr:hypothetical protein [Lachnospiraceae bacterium]
MKKLKQSEIRLLFLLVIVAMLMFSFQFGYQNNKEKTKVLETENAVLETELMQYRLMQQDEVTYREGLEKFKQDCSYIINAYGPGTSPENTTDYIIDLEENTGAKIYNISFGAPDIFFTSGSARNADGGVYEVSTTQVSLTYKADYEQFKKMVDYIQKYEERITIENVSIAFDQETGNLTGTISMNWYAMTGTDKVYEDPKVDGITSGKKNIFGTSN